MFRSPESVLRAKSIAIVGASERAPWARLIYRNLRDFGYPGRLILVNPRQKEVFGEPCVPSLRDAPEPVEHAMVIVPATGVAGVLEDAEAARVTTATIYSAAMGDGPDPESHKRGAWLKDFLGRSKIKVAGPNCMGAYSYHEKIFAYPNNELPRFPAGSVSAAFQSGGTLQFWLRTSADRGLRFSYGITSGNEISFDLADYLNFLVDDPNTKVIALFIEGIRRPDAFMAAAARALEAGKPIVAIKTGATAKSQAAAQSHTGAIGGDYAAYLAMCERYGIYNCRNLDDMMEAALAFDGGRLPKGPRIGFVTTSGGTVDLLYDYAEVEGASMPDYSPETLKGLMPYMQEGIEPKNPLDLGIPGGLKQAAGVCEVVAKDPNIDMIAWAAMLPSKAGAWDGVETLQAMVRGTDKPIVGFGRMSYQMTPEAVEAQTQAGFPFLQGLEPTIRALNGLWFHAQRTGKKPATPPPAPPSDLSPATLDATLKKYGIALPQSREVATAAEAAAAAEQIGFPVVLKIRSADILHKTEAGGVSLDLRSKDAVLKAADALDRLGKSRLSQREDRRLPGAGDGVRHRGDRRRAQRSLRPDAPGRRRRHPGRTGEGRGAAAAAGDEDRRDGDGRRPQAQQPARRLSRAARRRPRRAGSDRARARAILSRPPRAHRGHRDQSADGAPARKRRRRGRRARDLARR